MQIFIFLPDYPEATTAPRRSVGYDAVMYACNYLHVPVKAKGTRRLQRALCPLGRSQGGH